MSRTFGTVMAGFDPAIARDAGDGATVSEDGRVQPDQDVFTLARCA